MGINECVVVDTNVLAVAEGMNDSASPECVLACRTLLRRISEGLQIGVDTGDLVLREYIDALSASRSAGIGVKLARLLWRTRYDTRVCHRVSLTDTDPPPGSFAEVPAGLRDIDVDDHKFIAVSVAEGTPRPLFQAL